MVEIRPLEESFGHRDTLAIVVSATFVTACTALWPTRSTAVFSAIVGLILLVRLGLTEFSPLLFLIFASVSWFPEFSQTSWDSWNAQDFPSVYNYRLIPGLYASVFDYLFATIVLMWIVRSLSFNKRRALLKVPLIGTMAAYAGAAAFSLIYGLFRGGELYYAMREFRVAAYFVFTYLMVVTTMDSKKLLRRFSGVILAASAAVGVYGVIRYAAGIGKELGDIRIIYYDLGDSIVMFMGLFLLLSKFFAKKAGQVQLPMLQYAAFAPILFSFIFSYRRGAWVAFLCGFVFIILFSPVPLKGPHLRSKTAVIIGLALLLGVSLLIAGGGKIEAVGARFMSIADVTQDTSSLFRVLDALNAFVTFLHHPILGTGFGGRYEMAFYSELVAPAIFWDSASRACHNGYLFVLYKMGAIGFAIYMTLFIRFFAQWFRTRSSITDLFDRIMLCGLGASAVALTEVNMTSPVADSLRPALLLAVVMGLSASIFERTREQANVGVL